jgi:hypothetical protein
MGKLLELGLHMVRSARSTTGQCLFNAYEGERVSRSHHGEARLNT